MNSVILIWCLYCTKLAPISKTNDVARSTRLVIRNRQLRSTKAPPPPRFTRQPQKEKMFLTLLIFAGVDFSKMERTFFFLGFCPPSIRAVWRNNADEVLAKLFFGEERICQNFG